MSADALQQCFALAFKAQAPELFVELAQLVPASQQRSQLLSAAAAAGWLPSPSSAADHACQPDEQGVPEPRDGAAEVENTLQQDAGSAWQPLDRSRIAAAASGLAGSPDDGIMLTGSRSAAVDGAFSGAAGPSGRPFPGEPDLPPGVNDGGPRATKRTKRCSMLGTHPKAESAHTS